MKKANDMMIARLGGSSMKANAWMAGAVMTARKLFGKLIGKNGCDVTPESLEYAKPLVGWLSFWETF